jgi:hypothetical protein
MAMYEEDNGGNGGKFLKINGQLGCIVARSDEPKEGYEEYKTKNPQTDAEVVYYIKRYKGGVEGRVLGLERVELEGSKIFGYNLHMEDEDGRFSIYFADDRTTTQRLLKVYENIDLDNEVRIKVFKDEKGYPAIEFRQDGKNVPQKWVGGQDGNLPQPKKSKGKWDYSPVDEFLYENAMANIVPNYKAPEKAAAATAAPAEVSGADTDDIPF